MEESEGDIDVLQIANQENSPELLRNILYAGDRSICKLTNGCIHVIFSKGSGTKEFLKKYEYTLMTDLHEILKLRECIFFRTENNTFVTIKKSEETKFLFDLIDNINFRSKESGRWARVRWTDAKDTSEEQLIVYRINNINNDDDATSTGIRFPLSDLISLSVHMADRPGNARINRDISLKRIVRVTRKGDNGASDSTCASEIECVRLNLNLIQVPVYPLDNPVLDLPQVSQYQFLPHNPQRRHITNRQGQHVDRAHNNVSDSTNQSSTNLASHISDRIYPPNGFSRQKSSPQLYGNARHQEFVERSQRKESFSRWMYEKVQDPERLVDAGLFYTGENDLVRCFHCGVGLKDFSETDDPLHAHVQYSGQCEFLVNFLGNQKLEQLKAHLRNSDPEYFRQQQWLQIKNRPRPIPHTSDHLYRHPELLDVQSRLKTFDKWPNAIRQTPTQLAKAGFFYTGTADTVRCWACDGGLQKWDPLDDPWIEHCRWFPACPFAEEIKGEEYIRTVQRAAETGDESLLLKLNLNDKQQEEAVATHKVTSMSDEAEDSSRQIVDQLKEMGYKLDVINAALKSTAQKGLYNPDLTALIDEIGKQEDTKRVKKKRSTESLRRENERLKYLHTCTKCQTGSRECLFLPCKHLRMCMACSENLHRCPDCNAAILHKIRTFIP